VLIAAMAAPSALAQDAQPALLPEPARISDAVNWMARMKNEGPSSEGFYPGMPRFPDTPGVVRHDANP